MCIYKWTKQQNDLIEGQQQQQIGRAVFIFVVCRRCISSENQRHRRIIQQQPLTNTQTARTHVSCRLSLSDWSWATGRRWTRLSIQPFSHRPFFSSHRPQPRQTRVFYYPLCLSGISVRRILLLWLLFVLSLVGHFKSAAAHTPQGIRIRRGVWGWRDTIQKAK